MNKQDKVENGTLKLAIPPPYGKTYEFPDGVKVIGSCAFSGGGWRSYNQPLIIPEGVTEICSNAFEDLNGFNSKFHIPESVEYIGNSAFSGWLAFNQSFKLPSKLKVISPKMMLNWNSFNQPFVIPDSVTEIGMEAFCRWISYYKPIKIPDSVTKIGQFAFMRWYSQSLKVSCYFPNHFVIDGWLISDEDGVCEKIDEKMIENVKKFLGVE